MPDYEPAPKTHASSTRRSSCTGCSITQRSPGFADALGGAAAATRECAAWTRDVQVLTIVYHFLPLPVVFLDV
jgi:hypothetical protein